MNGTSNADYLAHRAVWFYLLNQGVLRAGTANSDSHSLTDNLLGTPRTLVWTSSTVAAFDEVGFNARVRQGHMLGTNGPVIEVFTLDAGGQRHGPSVVSFEPAPNADLNIVVSAAPWVWVEEVRIIVNGRVTRTLTPPELLPPNMPFGTTVQRSV